MGAAASAQWWISIIELSAESSPQSGVRPPSTAKAFGSYCGALKLWRDLSESTDSACSVSFFSEAATR